MKAKRTDMKIYISDSEKEIIKERAAKCGQTVSEFMRNAALGLPLYPREVKASIDKFSYEVHKAGVNINQIATVANTQKYIEPEKLRTLFFYQREIKAAVQNAASILTDGFPAKERHSMPEIICLIEDAARSLKFLAENEHGDN